MRTLAIILTSFCLAGCQTTSPDLPVTGYELKEYEHRSAPFVLKYPNYFSIDVDNSGLRLRYDGHPSVSIAWTTEEEADRRGLWADHEPVEQKQINNRTWDIYKYSHHDGPFYMKTISFVTLHKDRYFAVDFRTDGELKAFHYEILNNVILK